MAFVIKEHRPGRRGLYALLMIVTWVLSGILLYQYGWQQANKDYDAALKKQKSLESELAELNKANREMQVQTSRLSRSAQVDREAKIGIARSIKELQEQVSDLREEVSFYKGIVNPESGKSGLNIYRFSAEHVGGDLYHFKLILTQTGKSDNLTSGEVVVTFAGVLNDSDKFLELSDIQVSKQDSLAYRFRFFQELGGSFRLPKGFQPRSVVIKLLPKGRNIVEKPVMSFDWSQVRDGDY